MPVYMYNIIIIVPLSELIVIDPQKLLSFQSKDVSEVSKDTVDNLQYRINPCLHETERQTVESLLYIPPTSETNN